MLDIFEETKNYLIIRINLEFAFETLNTSIDQVEEDIILYIYKHSNELSKLKMYKLRRSDTISSLVTEKNVDIIFSKTFDVFRYNLKIKMNHQTKLRNIKIKKILSLLL